MFYSLTGKIIHINETGVAIDCSGVGFFCAASMNTMKKLGQKGAQATLYTHLNVREDAMDLFGFYDQKELDCFRLLIGVTGVGPKAALAILSQLEPEKLALCVASGDSKSITRANGVGPKIAQRVVLELKDKLGSYASDPESGFQVGDIGIKSASANGAEAVAALEMLGYNRSEASLAVGRLDDGLSTEELVRQALKALSKMK
ncbi:MAG: Holliday junction branch migration protein RuvA [Oscillospiraceae bacterium]|nr:Holliday junction branch migration protein RuvA [Oscillospiraceae bacterium]